jgi:predicted nucleic acid-binding protein
VLVVVDSGPVISLALIGKLDILEAIYGEICTSEAVWQEISRYSGLFNIPQARILEGRVKKLAGSNPFVGLMDSGEAEASALCLELKADYFIVDDRVARRIAEKWGIRCAGTLAALAKAKELTLISALRPLFSTLLSHNRYYKKDLLNLILADYGEAPLD